MVMCLTRGGAVSPNRSLEARKRGSAYTGSIVPSANAGFVMYHYYRRAVSVFGSGPSSIWFNGRNYLYRGYAYEKFIDAYNYAQLMLVHPSVALPSSETELYDRVHAPSAEDLRLMQEFGVEFVAGRYYYGSYRYDLLVDACAFARLAPGQGICRHNLQIAYAARHMNLLQERRMVDSSGQALHYRPVGRIGHYDIFPENATTPLKFKRVVQRS